jgi:hypothetical protein
MVRDTLSVVVVVAVMAAMITRMIMPNWTRLEARVVLLRHQVSVHPSRPWTITMNAPEMQIWKVEAAMSGTSHATSNTR